MKFLKFALVFAASALFVLACTQADNTANNPGVTNLNQRTNANPQANNGATNNAASTAATPADEVALGRTVYLENCVKCHKENGEGGVVEVMGKKHKASHLASEAAKKDPDAEFIDIIANGEPEEGMPAFKNSLSDAQIKAVVKFIRQDLQARK